MCFDHGSFYFIFFGVCVARGVGGGGGVFAGVVIIQIQDQRGKGNSYKFSH